MVGHRIQRVSYLRKRILRSRHRFQRRCRRRLNTCVRRVTPGVPGSVTCIQGLSDSGSPGVRDSGHGPVRARWRAARVRGPVFGAAPASCGGDAARIVRAGRRGGGGGDAAGPRSVGVSGAGAVRRVGPVSGMGLRGSGPNARIRLRVSAATVRTPRIARRRYRAAAAQRAIDRGPSQTAIARPLARAGGAFGAAAGCAGA